jgi:type IV pilus assembly protein PilB
MNEIHRLLKMTLLQQLVKKGLLDKEKAVSLEYEVKNSGKREEDVILERRIMPEEALFTLKSENLKIPLKKVFPDEVPLQVLELIPEDSARYYQIIPLSRKDKVLEVGMVYPEDIKAQEALEFLARRNKISYQISLITLSDFKNLLKRYRSLRGEVTRALEELETELKEERVEALPVEITEFERVAEEAPISKVVAVLLRHAVDGNASDIHIEPTKEKVRVRFRLDGELHSSIFLPLRILPAIVSRVKILSNLKIDETRIPQDGRFSTKIGGREIDFRVSTFPTVLGEKVAMRILDPQRALVDVKELGISGRNFSVIEKAIKKPFGMILVTGPTGSGKTTTLYALLRIVNKEGVNIMTLEDPVEYFIEGVNQSQVKPEIGYEFSTGLRHMLRQDPDILMVGEIRDEETATLAIHSSLTGHLVLSTLHTNNAVGVIPRLIDLGIKPYLIPPTLSVAIAQRLVRVLCTDCKKQIKPPKEIKDMIVRELEGIPQTPKNSLKIPSALNIYQAVGCKKCNNTGYAGRSGVFEVLEMTDQLAEITLREPSEVKIDAEAKRQGMVTMKQDGILKVLEGITTIEEVLRMAEEK